jgi:hypothetical protein
VHIACPKDLRHSLAGRLIDRRAFGPLNWGNPLRKCPRAIDIVQRSIDMAHPGLNRAERIRVLTEAARAQASAGVDSYSAELVDLLRQARMEQWTPPPIPDTLEPP